MGLTARDRSARELKFDSRLSSFREPEMKGGRPLRGQFRMVVLLVVCLAVLRSGDCQEVTATVTRPVTNNGE